MLTFVHMNPCIAIIDANTLSNTALRDFLWDLYNHVEVHTYNSIEAFIRDSNRHFIHFFVSADVIFSNPDEFDTLKSQTTVLVSGNGDAFRAAGFRTLNISVPENELTENIGNLLQIEHTAQQPNPKTIRRSMMKTILSSREKEVLALIVKGLMNKEIAVKLNISLPTAIFHRNNICDKLQTRSIGKLTVYAILQGIVDINEL